jgi:hypothetical protein
MTNVPSGLRTKMKFLRLVTNVEAKGTQGLLDCWP